MRKRPEYYKLVGENVVPCEPEEMPTGRDRIIRQEWITPTTWISTVFLGIDYNFGGEGPPILFETIIKENNEWGDMRRYSTVWEALEGHEEWVKKIRKSAGLATNDGTPPTEKKS